MNRASQGLDLHDHCRTAAVRPIIHRAVHIVGVIAGIETIHREPTRASARPTTDFERIANQLRKQRHYRDAHAFSPPLRPIHHTRAIQIHLTPSAAAAAVSSIPSRAHHHQGVRRRLDRSAERAPIRTFEIHHLAAIKSVRVEILRSKLGKALRGTHIRDRAALLPDHDHYPTTSRSARGRCGRVSPTIFRPRAASPGYANAVFQQAVRRIGVRTKFTHPRTPNGALTMPV